jgi:hypothetical protein
MQPIIKPTMKQHEAWQALQDKTTQSLFFGGGAGGGKSWLGCEFLLTNTFFYPGTKWFIAREELKRLMGSTFLTFKKVLVHHNIHSHVFKLNEKYNYLINTETGARIDLLDASAIPSDPLFERFGSMEFTGGWSEEAPELSFGAYEVLNSRMGRQMNKDYGLFPAKHLLTGNPTKGWPYKIFYKPNKEGTLPINMKFIQSLYKDNPHTAEEYGKQLALIRDKAQRERLMKGNWEYDDDPTRLIEYDAMMDLFTNVGEENADSRYLIIDVARFGRDRIIITLWHGLVMKKIWVKRKQGTNITEDDIRDLAQEYNVPYSHILIDEDGVGGGIVDHMKGVKGFVANRRPIVDEEDTDDDGKQKRPNFRNLKAQCAFLLADYINTHKIAVKGMNESMQMELVEELEQIKAKDPDKDVPLDLVPKDEVKDAIGRSPDISDTLIMRMYFELKKPKVIQANSQYTASWVSKRWARRG